MRTELKSEGNDRARRELFLNQTIKKRFKITVGMNSKTLSSFACARKIYMYEDPQ